MSGWIGVDLDGTLAEYTGWVGSEVIGDPIEPMVNRVKEWLADGKEVKIFTARVSGEDASVCRDAIERWCELHIGHILEVTNTKDYGMLELWDDRAVQVIPNKGEPIEGAGPMPRFTGMLELEEAARILNDALAEEHSTFDRDGYYYERYVRYPGEEELMMAIQKLDERRQ